MRHAVATLEGELLDAAVAEAVGFETRNGVKHWPGPIPFRPSVDWITGGPIIERERIRLNVFADGVGAWEGFHPCDGVRGVAMEGPTPLIAAMRAYVASKFGSEVDLP